MASYFVETGGITRLVMNLPGGDKFAVVKNGASSDHSLLPDDFDGEVDVTSPRPLSSPRTMLFPMREVVARYPDESATPDVGKSVTIVGVRACDLKALAVLDSVLLDGEFRDPFYAARRENALLISVDCVEPAEECFCTSVDGKPYPEENFDVNLSPVDGGVIVDVGSEKGKEAAVLAQVVVKEADDDQLAQRDENRKRVEAEVKAHNEEFQTGNSPGDVVKKSQNSTKWQEDASSCTECGACTLICPTCHCFLLYDQLTSTGEAERVRSVDSCLFASYARMAGAYGMKPSPRPGLDSRLQNRLLHKFVWLPETTGMLGCVGCGRCSEADIAGIDLRQFIKDLEG